MNRAHMEFCSSPEWRTMLEEQILPPVLRDLDLGDDVIEIGPGPGFTTDVLRGRAAHVTAVEIDEVLAERLAARLAGTNVEVVQRDATETGLAARLRAAGFDQIEIDRFEFGWMCTAYAGGS